MTQIPCCASPYAMSAGRELRKDRTGRGHAYDCDFNIPIDQLQARCLDVHNGGLEVAQLVDWQNGRDESLHEVPAVAGRLGNDP
jgi:hypothetical protein